jgi:hypothetical protein
MKRLTKLGLVIVVAALTCSAQQVEKRRPGKTTVFGPARSVRIERAEITSRDGQLIEGPRRLSATIEYTEDGTGLDYTVFRLDGSISTRLHEHYDSDGRMHSRRSGIRGNGLNSASLIVWESKAERLPDIILMDRLRVDDVFRVSWTLTAIWSNRSSWLQSTAPIPSGPLG